MSGWATEVSAPDLFFAFHQRPAGMRPGHTRLPSGDDATITVWHQAR